MRVARLYGALAVVVLLAGVAVGGVAAARLPTQAEARSLFAALPAFVRSVPRKCVRFEMRVSDNGRYAKVTPVFLNALRLPCVKYASNGYWILARTTRWRIIFDGSVFPSCSLRVPRDLSTCQKHGG